MKSSAHLIAAVLLCLVSASPASALLDAVYAPPLVEAGETFQVWIEGFHSTPCWEVQGYGHTVDQGVVTIAIDTVNTAPDTDCALVVVPYFVFEEVVVPAAGTWLIRVIEYQDDPSHQGRPDSVLELEITVTGSVGLRSVSWGSLRARYR